MTAQRWWVRMAARWLARIDGVSGQLRLAMLIMTGMSTATIALKQFGLGRYAVPLISLVGLAMLLFTYLYTEGGVWNQMSRDRRDLSNNWAGPGARIGQELLARGLAAAERERELTPDERAVIQSEMDAAFRELRDGIEIVDGGEEP